MNLCRDTRFLYGKITDIDDYNFLATKLIRSKMLVANNFFRSIVIDL